MPKGSPLIVLLGLFFACFGYGINLVSFCACVLALVVADGRVKSRSEINWLLAVAACVMLCITTTDVVVELCLNIALFVNKNLNADQQFGGISQWWNLTAFGCFLAQVALGDSILIYRCFVIWNRAWRVIVVSILLSITATACGLSLLILVSAQFIVRYRHTLIPLLTGVVVVALAQNVLTSSLIVFRLWAVQKESARYKMDRQNDRIGRAIRVTIDAGLPYTASLFVLLGFHIKAGQAQDVVMHAVVQVVGVSFNLVICRIVRNDPDEEILSSIMTLPSRPMVIKKEVVVSQTRPNDEWSSHSRWSMGSEVDGDHKARSLHPSEISDSQDEFR